jgi:hypothetical protein
MSSPAQWLFDLDAADAADAALVDGLVRVKGYERVSLAPEQRTIMEKAREYGAHSVFFEASRNGRPPVAQAFVFLSDGPAHDDEFADLHKRLWSWSGVPIVYRKTAGLVQLFRCAHKPDFEQRGSIVLRPFDTLNIASQIANKVASHPWWDAERLRNGTLWDDPEICKQLLSSRQAAQKTLTGEVKRLHAELTSKSLLPKPLRRRLLILSVLIAYLEARKVFEDDFFSRFKRGSIKFFQVLADGSALLKLLDHLEERFNGNVFTLAREERQTLRDSQQLARFAQLVEGRQEPGGQLTLWQRYSFADLPVEIISHIYQLFVKDTAVAVYTPHFVVRLMLSEVLNWKRLDRLEENDEVILDGACGSGIFLVEAYKRLVLHWRYRHNWKRPTEAVLKKLLTGRLRGVDKEEGAVELAAFSLCLALCDALEPLEIRASVKLFPPLKEKTLHTGCFFKACEHKIVKGKVGVIVGNPPFASNLDTEGAQEAFDRYQEQHGLLPDQQVAYLFLHESMEMLAPGGILSMLQQYNFLYNQLSLDFRRLFIERWDVREILDFISVRGLFQKGGADTKVLAVVAEAQPPPPTRLILHATFRRTSRTDAEQGFDLDYYDMHWLPRELVITNDKVWRTDLLGGGRFLGFVDRLKNLRTLGQYAEAQDWNVGEGFSEGRQGISLPAAHIIGKPVLPAEALTLEGIDTSAITTVPKKPIVRPRSVGRFTPPMLLVRELETLPHAVWSKSYLTYKDQIVGFAVKPEQRNQLLEVDAWLTKERIALQAYIAGISTKLFSKKATALSAADIFALPYPESGSLDLSCNDRILAEDFIAYYRDLIRLGDDSDAIRKLGEPVLPYFNDVFVRQINGIYRDKPLRPLPAQTWPGVICQPFIFGEGTVEWNGAEQLKGKIDALLREKRDGGLDVIRIARIYDGSYIYLLKPDRLRYWLRSIALRDADETLADLVEQGF